jgi:type III pantothenate kinase
MVKNGPPNLPYHSPAPAPELQSWLALVVGNTRLHWAEFRGDRLLAQWHTRHLTTAEVSALAGSGFAPQAWMTYQAGKEPVPAQPLGSIPVYGASVVPTQTALWSTYPQWHAIALTDIPLDSLYPTLGIDRALNLWAAGRRYGWPVLVVDAGTALTFTAGDQQALVGGAILPGITLQFQALGQQTATLPRLAPEVDEGDGQGRAPGGRRWATDTPTAIRSGIHHGILATVLDYTTAWDRDYPQGQVVITGGDGGWIYAQLQQRLGDRPAFATQPDSLSDRIHHCTALTFWGIQQYRASDRSNP